MRSTVPPESLSRNCLFVRAFIMCSQWNLDICSARDDAALMPNRAERQGLGTVAVPMPSWCTSVTCYLRRFSIQMPLSAQWQVCASASHPTPVQMGSLAQPNPHQVLVVTQSTYPKELESGALEQRFKLSTGTSILVGVGQQRLGSARRLRGQICDPRGCNPAAVHVCHVLLYMRAPQG
ncbi:hypothetical protein WJX84_000154 [Apatococcus fuscideae]|uniref:Uncharacterized protein n=1 Tax=Apatococcus fuscideae TaxID=2026836 RepID=A0AAW1T551_9CHLO